MNTDGKGARGNWVLNPMSGGRAPFTPVMPIVKHSFCMALLTPDLWRCWRDCQRCKLYRSRTQIVFGAGPANPPIMFIGEAPGEQEDRQGLPFIGRAGAVVNRLIEQIGLRREDVYLTSLVKCQPPGNRDPEPDEVAACRPLLVAQIEALHPLTICTFGRYATQTLLDTTAPISALRGKLSAFRGMPLMPTYHPAYLLRRPRAEREVRDDLMRLQQTCLQGFLGLVYDTR